MTGPLTYPPEIVIESKINLPPEIGGYAGCFEHPSNEVGFELACLLVEFVIELLGVL